MEREAVVHVDESGTPVRVGRLWSRSRRGKESAVFEYDAAWLKRPDRFALEPALTLAAGPHHTGAGRPLFGAIGDSAPDRWGRILMRRAERRAAERESRVPRTLFEIDFLLMVDDEVRPGALRFSEKEGGPFVAEPDPSRLPRLVDLPRLLSATERVLEDNDSDEDLRLLIAPGSSLGGARPKASVRDADGRLAIAKFPHREDTADAVLWEAVVLTLAARAGIAVPEWRVENAGGKAFLVVRRFDRRPDGRRVPFVSAMSMIEAAEVEGHSYLEIVEALRRHGAAPKEDLVELWKRVVFNVLVSNTDDHLRNHGFLYDGPTGWRLSPAYDMNPVPVHVKPRVLSTAIDPDDPTASLELALAHAEYFGLNRPEARVTAAGIAAAVSAWRSVAGAYGLRPREIDEMASAFEHGDMQEALALAA